MKFFSTNRQAKSASFFEAMRQGLAPDGGLYMPEKIPQIKESFWRELHTFRFEDIAYEMAKPWLTREISDQRLREVIKDAFNFPVKLREVESGKFVLELFHGPTFAFKDFGARFMARLFSEAARKTEGEVTILVATSGDTGSAVANGFYQVEGVSVCLLYPKGKVSPLQEKQMTTLGKNITAIEVDGVFDDCQRLVKQAFTDKDLCRKLQLSSANSINIARLLPQSFYYSWATGKLKAMGFKEPAMFSVPSGNFGNLTGGLLAMRMGLPVQHFLAATNRNDVVPKYLNGEPFTPQKSVHTISNAMDVGNPSNFVRMKALYEESDEKLRRSISGCSFSDEETRQTIRNVWHKNGYLLDPHTAIGYRAAEEWRENSGLLNTVVVLGTAHPVKFKDVIEQEINEEVAIPDSLKASLSKEKKTLSLSKEYNGFREFLLSR